MIEENVTRITVIHLLGFQIPHCIAFLVLFFFLIINCMTICGNLLIIVLVSYSKALHSPMYFFLSQLSVSDIILVTDILPTLLHVVLKKEIIIPLSECLTQFYCFAFVEGLECYLLTVMSYDRYVAICKPLHYALIMNQHFCMMLIINCWSLSTLAIVIYSVTIAQLEFCGPNNIDHFFCDLDPILDLSCSDTSIFQLEVRLFSVIFGAVPFFIIVVSYIYIIITIFKIPSVIGRQKVFSTCSSHLTVVFIYYVTLLSVYLVPSRGKSRNITKLLSLLYTEVTPLMNPIIYSLRNKDLKQVVRKLINDILNLNLTTKFKIQRFS